jgi:hypothetical protein
MGTRRVLIVVLISSLLGSLVVAAPTNATRSKARSKIHPALIDDGDRRFAATSVSDDLVPVIGMPSGNAVDLRRDLKELGLKRPSHTANMVGGLLPTSSLDEAADLDSLRFLRPEWSVTDAAVAVVSQGDQAQRSDDARSTAGFVGTGVTVGVISDSFGCNASGAASDAANNEVPTVNVVDEGACPASDEGRAMAQIVHDVAPAAGIAFHTGFPTQIDLAAGIRALRDEGAKVIVDDLAFTHDPWFQDGVASQAVGDVTKTGVSYFASAGNYRRNAYDSAFRDSGLPGLGTPPSGQTTAHDFDPSAAGTDLRMTLTIPAFRSAYIVLQWPDPWETQSTGSPAPGPKTDLDMYFYSVGTNTNLSGQFGATDNFQTGEPVEAVFVNNSASSSAVSYDIGIEQWDGPFPKQLKLLVMNSSATMEYSGGPTSLGHFNAKTTMAVGAANFELTPEFGVDPAFLSTYSSAGGTSVSYSASGKKFDKPSKRKTPDFVSPDCGNNTFLGADDTFASDADSYPNFCGTSAAAPHAAGVAALMLDKVASAKWYDVCNAMAKAAAASDMDVPGYDYDSGYGFLHADLAVQYVKARSSGRCRR